MSLIDTDKLIARKNIRAGDELIFHYFFPAPNADHSTIKDTAGSDAWGEYLNANAIELVSRPNPPAELPETPTLGWLHVDRMTIAKPTTPPDPVLGMFRSRRDVVDGGMAGSWSHEFVTTFTPATAVPTSALHALRDALQAQASRTPYRLAIEDFLADVDKANS